LRGIGTRQRKTAGNAGRGFAPRPCIAEHPPAMYPRLGTNFSPQETQNATENQPSKFLREGLRLVRKARQLAGLGRRFDWQVGDWFERDAKTVGINVRRRRQSIMIRSRGRYPQRGNSQKLCGDLGKGSRPWGKADQRHKLRQSSFSGGDLGRLGKGKNPPKRKRKREVNHVRMSIEFQPNSRGQTNRSRQIPYGGSVNWRRERRNSETGSQGGLERRSRKNCANETVVRQTRHQH